MINAIDRGRAAVNTAIESMLYQEGADIVRFVDISSLTAGQTGGHSRAVLLGMALSGEFVRAMYEGRPDVAEEYLEKEERVEALADRLADSLRAQGYRARSQSEACNLENGCAERAYIDPELVQGISVVPQKTIARLAGLGFIGKNNLLVTEAYGCALAMCTVLTDAPVTVEPPRPLPVQCGSCTVCRDVCPTGAIRGRCWSPDTVREDLVDVSKCACALRCMVHCPWTRRYAGSQ